MIRCIAYADTPFQCRFDDGTQAGLADLPVGKGGAGNGFGPHDLLEAALATCITITVQMAAVKHQIPLQGASCLVQIDRSVPGAITLNYDLDLEGSLSQAQLDLLREAACRCPVAKSLTSSISIQAGILEDR